MLNSNPTLDLFVNICSASAYLHMRGGPNASSPVCHRDIKPQNVLQDPRDPSRWKLIDFELASLGSSNPSDQRRKGCGTRSYLAPEALFSCGSPASDVWSIGVFLFCTFSMGVSLIPNSKSRQAVLEFFTSASQSSIDFQIHGCVPPSWVSLVCACLQLDATRRVSTGTLYSCLLNMYLQPSSNACTNSSVLSMPVECESRQIGLSERKRLSASPVPEARGDLLMVPTPNRRRRWSSSFEHDVPPQSLCVILPH